MGLFKTVFRRIGGRVVPIRISTAQAPSELQKVVHLQKLRSALKNTPTPTDPGDRMMQKAFYKSYKIKGSAVGQMIAKRMARIKKG